MSDNMKWPEKYGVSMTGTGGFTDGWNACLDECKRLNQPAEQPEMAMCGKHNMKIIYYDNRYGSCPECSSEPRLAPLDQQLVREELIKAGAKPHIAGALSSILCVKFGTSQLEALDVESVALIVGTGCEGYPVISYKTDCSCVKCLSARDRAKRICAKFAQPKEVKVSVEQLVEIIKQAERNSNLGIMIDEGRAYMLAKAILNFLNARGDK